jgi:hypothetical protein
MSVIKAAIVLIVLAVLAALPATPLPASAAGSSEPGLREWYLPNGIATKRSTTPETAVYDVTGYAQEWIHVQSLSNQDANVTLTFYKESEPPATTTLVVPAWRQKELFLAEGQLHGLVNVNQLYGLKFSSDQNVVVQVTRHESEANVEIPSNHLQSNIGYPGPLGDREKHWLYVNCWSLTSDPTWIEREWLNVLNPTSSPADVTVTFLAKNTGKRTQHHMKVPAERIATVSFVTLSPEIYRERTVYGVLVESTTPVVPMQIRRFFHAKNQSPRGMIGIIAFPLGDTPTGP